jgi:hypothetical protein
MGCLSRMNGVEANAGIRMQYGRLRKPNPLRLSEAAFPFDDLFNLGPISRPVVFTASNVSVYGGPTR